MISAIKVVSSRSKPLTFTLLVTGWLLALSCAALADYVPQGGDPPSGGSTTSGMRL